MAGILDEVLEGIAKKETPGQKPPEQTPAEPPKQTEQKTPTAPAEGGNPMNTYSDQFKEKYGEKKK